MRCSGLRGGAGPPGTQAGWTSEAGNFPAFSSGVAHGSAGAMPGGARGSRRSDGSSGKLWGSLGKALGAPRSGRPRVFTAHTLTASAPGRAQEEAGNGPHSGCACRARARRARPTSHAWSGPTTSPVTLPTPLLNARAWEAFPWRTPSRLPPRGAHKKRRGTGRTVDAPAVRAPGGHAPPRTPGGHAPPRMPGGPEPPRMPEGPAPPRGPHFSRPVWATRFIRGGRRAGAGGARAGRRAR